MLYHNLSDKIKSTSYGKNIRDFITLNKNVKIGDKYIDFTEQNTDGKNISISNYKGKYLLVDFWKFINIQ